MNANRRRGKASIGRGDGDGSWSTTGPGDAAVPRACTTVVAGRDDRQGIEAGRPRHGSRKRAIRERGIRLHHPDQRDARSVVCVAVVVRIDRRLEAGQDLVGTGVDGVPTFCVWLPAGDPYRQDRSSGRNAVEPSRAIRPGDDPCELGAMALGPAGNRRMRLCDATAPGVDDIDARENAAAEVGVRRVDSGVEQRDGHAGAVETRDLQIRDRRRQDSTRLVGLGWVCDPHRKHADDLSIVVEKCERRRVESRREPVDHPGVPVLGRNSRTRSGQAGEELLLLADGGSCPRAHVSLCRLAARNAYALGERGRVEENDVPLCSRDRRAHSEHPLPAGLVDRRAGRLLGTRSRREEKDEDRPGG